MYQKLVANLQVLNAKQSEIAELLPKAEVVRKSDDYITVLDDSFTVESISEEGRRLSEQLPQTVVSVGMENDEALELIVWQNGKQMAAHGTSSTNREFRKGNPQAFCQALRLPEEDIVRLETVWARGNIGEQLNLTGMLMGVLLDCSFRNPPCVWAYRDADWVDEWMRYLADYTKGKNQTKIQIIQELSGVVLDEQTDGNGWNGFFHFRPAEGGEDYDWSESVFCCPDLDGKLKRLPKLDPRPEVIRSPHAACRYIPIGKERVLSLFQEGKAEYSIVAEDSAGLLVCPLFLTVDGDQRSCLNAWAMEDGGILVLLDGPEKDETQGVLVRYAPDGMVLWSRRLEHACEPQLFSDGLLWLSDEEGFFSIGAQGEEGARISLIPERHIDRERNCIVKYTMLNKSLPGEVWLLENSSDMGRVHKSCKLLSFDLQGNLFYDSDLPVGVDGLFCEVLVMGRSILLYQYDQGIWLLSALNLETLAGSEDHRNYLDAASDGAGRIWVFVGDETEAYDEKLALVSRHRMRGEVLHHYQDQKGRLCAVTYGGEKNVVRVYRLA